MNDSSKTAASAIAGRADAPACEGFKPDWRVHPGELLREILTERDISQTYLAWATGYSLKHINRTIQGHHAVTATMAVRLERELGAPSADFWLRAQMIFDLHAAREAEQASR